MTKKSRLIIPLLTGIFFISTLSAEAAVVKQVKGSKALIELETEEASVGQEFYLIDSLTGKKKALIVIKQIKGNKAIADIIKGKAEPEQGLLPKGEPQKKSQSYSDSASDSDSNSEEVSSASKNSGIQRKLGMSFGALGAYNISSMSAKYKVSSVNGTTNMSGNTFGFGGFFNYPILNNVSITGIALYEAFNVKGTASGALCNSNTDANCKLNMTYLSFYGQLRYYFNSAKWRPWISGGGGFQMKMSASSNVLTPPSSNQIVTVGGGVDYQLSRKHYIPVSFDYQLYPPTSTVSANMMVIKAGYAWNF